MSDSGSIISIEELTELLSPTSHPAKRSLTELAASQQRRADVMLRLAILEDRERSTIN